MAALPPLTLFSREGCCLCAGLADRLAALPLPPQLQVVDIDTDPALKARYDLEVPVLAVGRSSGLIELPRVPPRLRGDGLERWLGKALAALSPPPA
ncbi:glutaredoxin family protein [Synechococcus sp. CS-602]|uniref:glutaredoxin family protein n=1 Tax=Synechococcaceae TaxID=1890426 RepID=UPI0008FF27D4|nr:MULTISPECIES: glutaredoxin family protein [Synechococcaceae]MCT4365582.1 glutaredoxin family protein [Candidatus Regnicoccus frigidus MAG-AL1]APD47423.1 thioredoxin family protein [Synechococcus sp. SynAce01]MCT0202648.1 glutaredoxin family protein [Synechococcus sp. CS-603]MCT0204452.1 glutaredoxin family protein [Synechococcus sp. CS-602]MCT0247294.1 glutaredoxin family protein [Synechococcus sp. CS-601]